MKPKLKVWVLFGDRVKVGPGRAALLRLIDELGSMKQAVARFEMSYRYAWGYLRELEQAAGFRLVERQAGGSRTAGTRLTPQGREFLDRYERFAHTLERSMARCFDRAFPPTTSFMRHRSHRGTPQVARVRGQRQPRHKTA